MQGRKDSVALNKIYSVTQINLYIKNMFTSDYALNNIYIKGEVSNCKYHTSGHIYFTLKDVKGQMACVMFAGNRSGLNFKMSEGQSVVALGSVSVYERDGKYQLYVREILLDGAGILHQQFEELKVKLEEEGLFDPMYKRAMNPYPKRIGIVTAVTGAAIQDMISVATRRNPYVQLILYPAKVQGEGASLSIVKGIKALDRLDVDTIIIGRGGGSIEDLWAFNEEVVARAIFDSNTPIISAVGHETDTTISDFVSDLRAPTPSAAAELAISPVNELFMKIDDYNLELNNKMEQKIVLLNNKIDNLKIRLEHSNPMYQVRQKRQFLINIEDVLHHTMTSKIKERRHQLALYIEQLNGLSPIRNLNKGYGLIADKNHVIVSSVKKVSIGEEINIAVSDGDIRAVIADINTRGRS